MVHHIGYLHISETYSLCYRENPVNFRIFHKGKRARKEDGGGRWWMVTTGDVERGWWLGIVGSGCWWTRIQDRTKRAPTKTLYINDLSVQGRVKNTHPRTLN